MLFVGWKARAKLVRLCPLSLNEVNASADGDKISNEIHEL